MSDTGTFRRRVQRILQVAVSVSGARDVELRLLAEKEIPNERSVMPAATSRNVEEDHLAGRKGPPVSLHVRGARFLHASEKRRDGEVVVPAAVDDLLREPRCGTFESDLVVRLNAAPSLPSG